MGFQISVRDDERDALILAHWLLTSIYKLSGEKHTVSVRKIDAFKDANLGGFKGDLMKHGKYTSYKGDDDYWRLVEDSIGLLVNVGWVAVCVNTGYVNITPEGIKAVNSDTEWNKKYYPPK